MVLPSANTYITFSNIQTEFGGGAPIWLSEYYRGGNYVAESVTGVPASGYISLANFAGKSKPVVFGNAPSYYTSSSSYVLYSSWNSTVVTLRTLDNIATTTNIRTYNNGKALDVWTLIHDKDLDSNVFYGMQQSTRVLSKYEFAKGGTTSTSTSIYTMTSISQPVLGACYAPACMGVTHGAFIIGGYQSSAIVVMEFNATKTGVSYTYTVPYANEVYGTEVIPKDASGFTNDFAIAYTRANKTLSSWTVDLATRTWTNRYDITYGSGTTGPSNGCGAIYYPIGKPIYVGDPNTTWNRVALNDTGNAKLFVWKITQNGDQLVFTFLIQVPLNTNGGYPYHLSVSTYNAII